MPLRSSVPRLSVPPVRVGDEGQARTAGRPPWCPLRSIRSSIAGSMRSPPGRHAGHARAQTPGAAAGTPAPDQGPLPTQRYRAVVVGYGPVGQTVTRLLRDNDIEPTVIELNRETVHRLRVAGVAAVYGDASHRETLQGAGVNRAGSLILSSAGMQASAEVIRLARELNPAIRVLARSAYVHEIAPLRQAGAEQVFACEGEVALALTESILRALGATPEQIDRERDRVHADLVDRTMGVERQEAPPGQAQPTRDT